MNLSIFQSAEVKFKSSGASTVVKSVDIEFNLNRDVDASFALVATHVLEKHHHNFVKLPVVLSLLTQSIQHHLMAYLTGTSLTVVQTPYINLEAATQRLHLYLHQQPTTTSQSNYTMFREAPTSNVSGRDTQTMSLSFTALFDETKKAMATCDIRNGQSSL